MKTIYAMFAGYNRWANRRLYAAALGLPETDYRADRGAFFGSLHGTLSHLIVTDRIWLQRFTGEGPTYARLDVVPYDDREELAAARAAEDDSLAAYVEGLSGEAFAATFTYRTVTNPRDITQPLAPALSHLFNHQTHHRGQAHALLTAIAGKDAAPALDLLFYQRETGAGMS